MAIPRRMVLLGVLTVIVGIGSVACGTFVSSGSAVAAVSDCVRAAGLQSRAVAATTSAATALASTSSNGRPSAGVSMMASGTPVKMSMACFREPNVMNSSMKINPKAIGTTSVNLADAFCRFSN